MFYFISRKPTLRIAKIEGIAYIYIYIYIYRERERVLGEEEGDKYNVFIWANSGLYLAFLTLQFF